MTNLPPALEIEQLQARLQQLAGEKAALHLVLRLIQRINPLAGIDELLHDLLNSIMDTIGGTNIKLYYWDATELHYLDFLGENKVVPEIEDPLARQVAERQAFVEQKQETESSMLLGAMIAGACSWGFPLVVGDEFVGAVTIENLHVSSRSLGKHLPVFFDHAALILSNELRRLHRERTKQALLEKTEELDSYFNHALDLFAIADTDGYFRKLNPSWEGVLGYPLAELEGTRFLDYIHPEDLQATLDAVAALGAQKPVMNFVNRYRHRDGSWRWIEWRSVSKGNKIYAAARDITERKETEIALRRWADIFEHVSWGVIVGGAGTRTLELMNPAFAAMHGYSVEELTGRPIVEVFAPECWSDIESNIQLAHTQGHHTWESKHVRKDGTIFPVLIDVTVVQNELGEVLYRVSNVQDITERKRTEEEKSRLQAQFLQSQKMESLGSLAGGIAHDMNNVLGAILGLASANMSTQPVNGPIYRAFETISKAAERGGKMVKSLLSFARQSPVEEQELDVNVILREEIVLLERTTLSKVRLEMDFEPGLRPIRGDAGALTHAFMNLCVNAVDAMPEAGTLTLRTRNRDDGWIEVQVEDTGTGMPPEVLERALDPFFTTKAEGKGTGLGLSMVYATVMAHRGQMEIQSVPGRGTLVKLRFPACSIETMVAEPVAEPPPEPSRKGLQVLLVDDDDLIQSSIQCVLESLGHHTTLSTRGEEALARLEAGLPCDVVILDMNMPGLGGAGTLPRLRALRPDLPVLLSTGRVDQAALDLVEAYPRVWLLSKPFSLEELKQKLTLHPWG